MRLLLRMLRGFTAAARGRLDMLVLQLIQTAGAQIGELL